MAANHSEAPREPLLTRAGIVTAISVLSALCVHLGAGNVSAWLGSHSELLVGLILALSPVITAVLARMHVTPYYPTLEPVINVPAPAGNDSVLEAADAAAAADVAAEPAPTS